MIIRRKLFAKKDYDGLNFIARRKKRIEREVSWQKSLMKKEIG